MPGGVYGYSGANTVSPIPTLLTDIIDRSVIQAWFDARFQVADGSSNISRLYDRSGKGRDATQGTTASQPVLTQYKGFPTACFNGSKNLSCPRPLADDMTVIMVLAFTTAHGTGAWYADPWLFGCDIGGVTNDCAMVMYGTTLGWGFGNPDVTATAKDSLNDGNFHVSILRRNKAIGMSSLYVDGAAQGFLSHGTASMNAPSVWYVGLSCNVYLAEVVALSTCVNNTIRSQVEAHFMAKYPIPSPAGNMVLT